MCRRRPLPRRCLSNPQLSRLPQIPGSRPKPQGRSHGTEGTNTKRRVMVGHREDSRPVVSPMSKYKTRPQNSAIFDRRGKNALEVAYTNYGYRIKEISEHLGIHYATVSGRLRKLEQEKRDV